MRVDYRAVELKARSLRETIAKMERTVLELLAHPEATDEQIKEVRAAYQDILKRKHEANTKLFQASHGWYRIIKI